MIDQCGVLCSTCGVIQVRQFYVSYELGSLEASAMGQSGLFT